MPGGFGFFRSLPVRRRRILRDLELLTLEFEFELTRVGTLKNALAAQDLR